tara:strand:+ start:270 stop:830 length:561 start_codon:yes stop_codon:yes gene_type:complete
MNKIVEDWFHLYSDELYGWAYHKTSSKEISEDLVQETFLAALKGFKNFRHDSQPKTWLFAILNNKIIDYYRKKARSFDQDKTNERMLLNRTKSYFDAHENWKITGKEMFWEENIHLLDDEEFSKILNRCLNELPDSWCFSLVSKYLLEKSAAQICQEIEVTRSNYWQIVHRAKLMVKKCIDLNWKN